MRILKKYNPKYRLQLLLSCTISCGMSYVLTAQAPQDSVQIDGAEKYQTIDGFGVNINTAWWYDGAYRNTDVVKPAIDMLVDSLDATIFRAVIEDMDLSLIHI